MLHRIKRNYLRVLFEIHRKKAGFSIKKSALPLFLKSSAVKPVPARVFDTKQYYLKQMENQQ